MAERRRETSHHLNNLVTALQASASLLSQCPFVCDTAERLAEHFRRRARNADHKRVANCPAEGGDPRIVGIAAYLPTKAAHARETIQPTHDPATSRGYLRGRISYRVGKAVRLIRVGRFRDAVALAENHGVAEPSAENIDELRRLFPLPAADDPFGLLPPPEPDDLPPIIVCPDDLHGVLQRAPADSACRRDGWRVDHLRDLSDDSDTLQSMARFMTVVCSGNVSDRIKQLLSSSTLNPLWKKDEEERGDLRG
eukprot:jgi/Tetstr1/428933/TSEL_018909.t1